MVQLKPPKKNETPKIEKPKPKTKNQMNQNQPSTSISSITKFFETVFIPKEPERPTRNQGPTKPEPTSNQKTTETTIKITRLTTKPETRTNLHARQDVLPDANDDKPLEFPSTP